MISTTSYTSDRKAVLSHGFGKIDGQGELNTSRVETPFRVVQRRATDVRRQRPRQRCEEDRFSRINYNTSIYKEEVLKLPVRKTSFDETELSSDDEAIGSKRDGEKEYTGTTMPFSYHHRFEMLNDQDHSPRPERTRRRGIRVGHSFISRQISRSVSLEERPCMIKSSGRMYDQRDSAILRPYRQLSSENLAADVCIGEEEIEDEMNGSDTEDESNHLPHDVEISVPSLSKRSQACSFLNSERYDQELLRTSEKRRSAPSIPQSKRVDELRRSYLRTNKSLSYPSNFGTFMLPSSMGRLSLETDNVARHVDEKCIDTNDQSSNTGPAWRFNDGRNHRKILTQTIDLLRGASDTADKIIDFNSFQ